jgi:hypothetical protein
MANWLQARVSRVHVVVVIVVIVVKATTVFVD